jgi:hypothetical protein
MHAYCRRLTRVVTMDSTMVTRGGGDLESGRQTFQSSNLPVLVKKYEKKKTEITCVLYKLPL